MEVRQSHTIESRSAPATPLTSAHKAKQTPGFICQHGHRLNAVAALISPLSAHRHRSGDSEASSSTSR